MASLEGLRESARRAIMAGLQRARGGESFTTTNVPMQARDINIESIRRALEETGRHVSEPKKPETPKEPTLPKELMADLEQASPERVAQMSEQAVAQATGQAVTIRRTGNDNIDMWATTTTAAFPWGGGAWGATSAAFNITYRTDITSF